MQGSLFDVPKSEVNNDESLCDRFQGAVLFSAVGDALGWPTEFIRPNHRYKPHFRLPIRDFVRWQKMVGGRWWGFRDEIKPGEYSDDTQLSLAIARSISSRGDFEPSKFAYYELPLWLHYERGGGRSIKTAARNLTRRRSDWWNNFYRIAGLEYRHAGANGAAMRNLPIALVCFSNKDKLIYYSFLNAIITHGHPRAIMGTILSALSVRYAILHGHSNTTEMIDYLQQELEGVSRLVGGEWHVRAWIKSWEHKSKGTSFKVAWDETKKEVQRYLKAIHQFLNNPLQEYYTFVGALNPATKGSGIGTVCVAIYLFLRDNESIEERLYQAVNMLGSDTDTIASFTGALVGAQLGPKAIPTNLFQHIQDREYLLKTAARLCTIAEGKASEYTLADKSIEKEEAFLRILAWEIGLHEMFWDAIDIGGEVVHPALGKGTITEKHTQRIGREGYVTRLIGINFDCGQSCLFHSRVENERKVAESLGFEIQRALRY
jgi:ADP-ribosylglycohydrolase